MTDSYMQLQSGGTQYPFTFYSMNEKQAKAQNAVNIKETVNAPTIVKMTDGMIRKSVTLSILFHTDPNAGSGGQYAAEKLYSFKNFVNSNQHKQMTLHVELHGGAVTKDWIGKVVGELTDSISSLSPEEIMLTFEFVLEQAGW